MGTFIIGVAGVISTAVFKNYELKISSRTAENTYLNAYITQYSNMEKADSLHKYDNVVEMFHVLSLSTQDADLKSSWEEVSKFFATKIINLKDSSVKLGLTIKHYDDSLNMHHENLSNVQQQIEKAKSSNNEADVAKLTIIQSRILDSISLAEAKVQQLASQKLNADKFSAKVLLNPVSSLPTAAPDYAIIYDADRYAGINYQNSIINGIIVYVNGLENDIVKIETGLNGRGTEYPVKIGESKEFTLSDGLYKVVIRIISYTPGRIFKKAYITYHITVQQKQTR